MAIQAVHHLNCGSMHPYVPRIQAIVYCLLLETDDGLVLVDTGFGTQDYRTPTRLMRAFLAMMRVPRDLDETAARQVVRLGYTVDDVRHIILTHMHLDHAGGLPDFPHAHVHVFRPEYVAATHPRGLMGSFYIQQHWAHRPQWVIHEQPNDTWFDFDSIAVLDGIHLIPLPGHTPGHCGVAIDAPEGWLFHCGDAISPFYGPANPNRTDARRLSWYVQKLIGPHAPRLRQFAAAHRGAVRIISGHDIDSFNRIAQSNNNAAA